MAAKKFNIFQKFDSIQEEEKVPQLTPDSAKNQGAAKHYNIFFCKATKFEKFYKAQEDFQCKRKLDLKTEIKNLKKKTSRL